MTVQPRAIDTSHCDREPIHIPGSIQPHGLFFAVMGTEFTIVHVSNNINLFFDTTADDILYTNFEELISEQDRNMLLDKLSKSYDNINPLYFTVCIGAKKVHFEAVLHRSGGLILIELEPYSPKQSQEMFYHLAKQAISRLQTLPIDCDLGVLTETAADEVRKMTGFDRVMIYQFDSDGHGEVISESKQSELEPFLGLRYPASDIPKQARVLYLKNWLRLIPNVNYTPALIVPSEHAITHNSIDLSHAVLRSVSPIHLQYLRNMGVSASMSISLICNGQLWGLIACHHHRPRQLSYEVRTTCEFLGQILSWHITSKVAQMESKMFIQQNQRTNVLLKKISLADNWVRCCAQQAKILLGIVNATGAVLFVNGEYTTIGRTPELEQIKTMISELTPHMIEKDIYSTQSISTIYPQAAKFKEVASGVLALSLFQNNTDLLLWFRPEVLQTINWAGDPKKVITSDEKNFLMPRTSFALYQEQKSLCSSPWTPIDMKIIKDFKQIILEVIVKQAIKAKQDAKVRQKQQEEFVDTICHEIRNPINGITGSLTTIDDQIKGITDLLPSLPTNTQNVIRRHISEIEKAITDAQVCAKHQTEVANDVLMLSKLDSRKMEIVAEPYDVHQEIRVVCRMITSQLAKRNLSLELALQPTPRIVKGDSFRLRQVLVNLLSNSIKFTERGVISITYRAIPEEDRLHFSVNDTGIGMTEEEQLNLFQPFTQANRSISSQYGGTGLGLSISRQLVDLMGGTITVVSKKGAGTMINFTVQYLPLMNDELERFQRDTLEKTQITPTVAMSPRFEKILIVDDNVINRKVLVNALKKYGYICETAVDGSKAIEMIEHTPFDLCFMDVMMPVLDGYQATIKIREREKKLGLKPLPIICLSGNVSEEHKKSMTDCGMNDFISKPFETADLLEKVKRYLPK